MLAAEYSGNVGTYRAFWWKRPDHERGDFFLLNEPIHVFPSAERLLAEAERSGLQTVAVYRDQRAYDRGSQRVRGYAVLRLRS